MLACFDQIYNSLALAFVTQKATWYANVSAEIGRVKTGTVRKNLL